MEAKNQMKALIFDPYLDTLGGGERYVGGVAQTLVKKGYEITFAWSDDGFIKKMEERFGIVLEKIKVDPTAYNLFKKSGGVVQKFFLTKKYDLIFWVSDGSLPFLFSKNNLVHFQVPFPKDPESNPLIKSLKTSLINKFIYNSEFTRNILEKYFPKTKGLIFYPPIDVESFSKIAVVKSKTILSVGRFDSPSHPKRQDLLIEAFKLFSKSHPDYKLVLAGGLIGDSSLLDNLKESANGLKVEFIVNPDFNTLKKLYQSSKFFWHAAGMEIDEALHPEKVEHFGMSVVEAMAAGSIPIVANKGGLKEIITPNSGYLCQNTNEISRYTSDLIKNKKNQDFYSKSARDRANNFSVEEFSTNLSRIIA